jgi:hypothetical protein
VGEGADIDGGSAVADGSGEAGGAVVGDSSTVGEAASASEALVADSSAGGNEAGVVVANWPVAAQPTTPRLSTATTNK